MITGESRPVPKADGDRVVAGTVSTDSSIRVRVDAVGDDTALAGIQRLVAEAQASRSRAQALADRFAAVLFYVATAAGRSRSWPGRSPAVSTRRRAHRHRAGHRLPARPRVGDPAGDRAVDGRGGEGRHPRQGPTRPRADAPRRHGAVRQDRHADQGRPRRHRRRRRGELADDEALGVAAAVEADSEHPLARAIVGPRRRDGRFPGLPTSAPSPAAASRPSVDGTPYAVGGPALLRERQPRVPVSCTPTSRVAAPRRAVLYLVRDDEVVGAFALEDEIRPEAQRRRRRAAQSRGSTWR